MAGGFVAPIGDGLGRGAGSFGLGVGARTGGFGLGLGDVKYGLGLMNGGGFRLRERGLGFSLGDGRERFPFIPDKLLLLCISIAES